MKKNKGAVLTGVILMVLVMTLIGVPLLGMVVYNYRLVELSNSIKRSEYENEMAMDIISVIIRENVIDAISYAKDMATTEVNALAELQKTNYSSTYGEYTSLWINEYNLWENGVSPKEEILGGFLTEIETRAGTNVELTIREWWNSISSTERENIKETKKQEYILTMVESELGSIESDGLSESEDEMVGTLVDSETGMLDEEALNEAYNNIFRGRYQAYINDKLQYISETSRGDILVADEYVGIVSERDNIDVSGKENLDLVVDGVAPDNYLKIMKPVMRFGDSIEVDVGTMFKKNKTTPPTRLYATFVIKTPAFDSVASVTQENISLSNALLNQGGVVVGGKLTLASGTTMKIANDLTVIGDGVETAVLLENGSSLLAGDYIDTDNFEASNSRISIAKDIVLRGNTDFETGNNPIYYRNLYVGDVKNPDSGEIKVGFNGDAVAEDDLEINHEGKVTITQVNSLNKIANYYGFNDTNNKGPDSSSSIIFNSTALSNKVLKLGNLYLAGRAFIEDVQRTKNPPIIDEDGNVIYSDSTYKTGESVAIKGNYLAYQTLLDGELEDENEELLSFDKVSLGEYFFKKKDSSEKENATIWLVEALKADMDKGNFDVHSKWRYFKQYVELYKDNDAYKNIIKSINLDSNVRYIEGTAFDNTGDVIGSSNESISDTSFRNNLADEYEKYTKYFGYRPVKEDGTVDTSKAKTEIFGSNGWIKFSSASNIAYPKDITGGKYYQVYVDGNKNISLSGDVNKGIIVCTGNLTINVPSTSSATFSGVIIVGGNLTVNGGTLVLTDSKEEVINTVIGNYLGTNAGDTGVTGTQGEMFKTFTYDGSGSTYIVTEIGNSLININELIGITNWKKSNYGRL